MATTVPVGVPDGVQPGWIPDPMCLEPWEEQDEPLASERHHLEQDYCVQALKDLLGPKGYFVTRDCWLKVDPTGVQRDVQPDLLIAYGVHLDLDETTYDPWALDKVPDMLAEFLSITSVTADLEGKPDWYGRLGVREYFRFDVSHIVPGGPVLAGFSLTDQGTWAPLPFDSEGGLTSQVLGIRFVMRDHLTIIDLATGEPAPTSDEKSARLRQADRERLREADARQLAEEGQREADRARQQEAEARVRAEAERQEAERARKAAEEELAHLRAELERLRQEHPG